MPPTTLSWEGRLLLAVALSLTPVAAVAAEKVVVRTDFKFNGYIAPFALALERGDYKAAGLDVEIGQGQGSTTTIQTVASGADTLGIADSAVVLLGVSAQNIPVKVLSVYLQTGVSGLIYLPASGWDGRLEGLRGRPVISSAGAADLTMLTPALNTVAMSPKDVDLRLVDPAARVPVFLQTPAAVLTGFAAGDFLRVRMRAADAQYKPYADYGIIAYSTGLIATHKTISEKPQMLRAFVQASAKGWAAAGQNPEAAVEAALKLFPDLDQKMLLDGLKIVLQNQLHTAATKGKPVGWTAESDWKMMIEILERHANLKPREPSAYYTNEFVAER
jgi:NitT/TauT family transport system substrate-binding protein